MAAHRPVQSIIFQPGSGSGVWVSDWEKNQHLFFLSFFLVLFCFLFVLFCFVCLFVLFCLFALFCFCFVQLV